MYGFNPNKELYYLSAYGEAVKRGFQGTPEQWLESLKGPKGDTGKSAYKSAVDAGYPYTEEQFNQHLSEDGKGAFEYAIEGGWTGTEAEFIQKLAAMPILILNEKAADSHGRYTLTAADLKALSTEGGTMTGALLILDPAEDMNPVTLKYLKEYALAVNGGTMKGPIHMNQQAITNLPAPKSPKDAATKESTETFTRTAVNGAMTGIQVTLNLEGWQEDQTQTVDAAGVTANSLLFPAPDPADDANATEYYDSYVELKSQAAGKLTFKWKGSKPGRSLLVNVAVWKGAPE